MKLTSMIAIYALFWVMSAFLLLPFGVKTPDEDGGELVPGQATSAPVNFRPGRIVKRATVLAAVLFGLYYANYVNGWIGVKSLDFFNR
jgi:predicted secreted protein